MSAKIYIYKINPTNFIIHIFHNFAERLFDVLTSKRLIFKTPNKSKYISSYGC